MFRFNYGGFGEQRKYLENQVNDFYSTYEVEGSGLFDVLFTGDYDSGGKGILMKPASMDIANLNRVQKFVMNLTSAFPGEIMQIKLKENAWKTAYTHTFSSNNYLVLRSSENNRFILVFSPSINLGTPASNYKQFFNLEGENRPSVVEAGPNYVQVGVFSDKGEPEQMHLHVE